MSELVIRLGGGHAIVAVEIDGWLAVHRVSGRPGIWAVTHVKSGLTLSDGHIFPREGAAITVANKIWNFADWSLDGQELLARHPDLKAKIARIARKHGSVRAGHA